MKMVVGLGNPGDQYKNTRHNIGFMVLDYLAGLPETGGSFEFNKKFNAEVLEWIPTSRSDSKNSEKILFVKPMTYMNLSGEAVAKVVNFYKIALEDILLVHDDIDLPFGEIRVRKSGRSGGHNGVESVLNHLNTEEIARVKIGIGKEGDPEKYVLMSFDNEQKNKLESVVETAVKIVQDTLQRNNLDNESFSII